MPTFWRKLTSNDPGVRLRWLNRLGILQAGLYLDRYVVVWFEHLPVLVLLLLETRRRGQRPPTLTTTALPLATAPPRERRARQVART